MSHQGDDPLEAWPDDDTVSMSSMPTSLPRPPRRGRRTLILVVTAVVIGGLLVAAGLYVGLGAGRQSPPAAAGSAATGSTAARSPAAPSATAPAPSPPPLTGGGAKPGASQGASHESVVLAASEVDKPDAPAIVELFTSYFNAINDRDYATYVSLLENGQDQKSQASFETGYRTTVDTEIGIDRITPTPDGTLVQLSFTSRQDAADAADGTSTCLVWQMEFRVVHKADQLLIAPPGMSDPEYRSC